MLNSILVVTLNTLAQMLVRAGMMVLPLELTLTYLFMSGGLLITSLILLVIPGGGGCTRLVKSAIYLGFIGVSGYVAFAIFSSGGVPVLIQSGDILPEHNVITIILPALLTVFKVPLVSDPIQTAANVTTIVLNMMTIIMDLVGLAKELDGKEKSSN